MGGRGGRLRQLRDKIRFAPLKIHEDLISLRQGKAVDLFSVFGDNDLTIHTSFPHHLHDHGIPNNRHATLHIIVSAAVDANTGLQPVLHVCGIL